MSKPPVPVRLSEQSLHLRPHRAEFLPKKWKGATKIGESTLTRDPELEGLLMGETHQRETGSHGGERQLDGDRILYLIVGSLVLTMDPDDGVKTDIELTAGDAVIIPRGIWHRFVVIEPCRYLFIGGGRTEIRRAV